MSQETITVRIYIAWWLRPYVALLGFFAQLMGTEPDEEKLGRIVESAIRYEEIS